MVDKQPGSLIYAPLFDMYNSSKVTGLVNTAIKLGLLIHSSINVLLSSAIISVVDANTTDIDTALLYNSMSPNTTDAQNLAMINASPFNIQQTIQFADRLWNINSMPTATFLSQHSTILK